MNRVINSSQLIKKSYHMTLEDQIYILFIFHIALIVIVWKRATGPLLQISYVPQKQENHTTLERLEGKQPIFCEG